MLPRTPRDAFSPTAFEGPRWVGLKGGPKISLFLLHVATGDNLTTAPISGDMNTTDRLILVMSWLDWVLSISRLLDPKASRDVKLAIRMSDAGLHDA